MKIPLAVLLILSCSSLSQARQGPASAPAVSSDVACPAVKEGEAQRNGSKSEGALPAGAQDVHKEAKGGKEKPKPSGIRPTMGATGVTFYENREAVSPPPGAANITPSECARVGGGLKRWRPSKIISGSQ